MKKQGAIRKWANPMAWALILPLLVVMVMCIATTAVYADTVTLTVTNSSGGTVTDPGVGAFPYENGSTANLSVSPYSGYMFTGWTGNTATIQHPTWESTTMNVSGNYSIRANFEETPVTPMIATMLEIVALLIAVFGVMLLMGILVKSDNIGTRERAGLIIGVTFMLIVGAICIMSIIGAFK